MGIALRNLMLPKAKVEATIWLLEPDDLPKVIALQEETRNALPEAQKMFVLPQQPDYFKKLLAQENGLMLGVVANGHMIAQMAVMGTVRLEDAIHNNLITRNEVHFHHANEWETVVIAKSMAVHPDWRGNDLSATMVEAMLGLPQTRAADHVFAQISADNIRSWDVFLRHGFGIVAAAIDPNDHKARFVLQRPALGFALHPHHAVDDIDPTADFAAILRLTGREALVGRPDLGVGFKLAFYASTEHAAAWDETVPSASIA